ncbi:hypothetical protein DERF_012051 [Dermatophagoides farinae]|uniref:Uncharacterized protein n=1 Tax=Dermatophagoides farinae TaxID=6954 RepID=A0A922HTA9_DERFA|nr:hypothetical protein DERF_012051 [Dermatophagoides farinae]
MNKKMKKLLFTESFVFLLAQNPKHHDQYSLDSIPFRSECCCLLFNTVDAATTIHPLVGT